MKYENIDKVISLKSSIDVTNTEIAYVEKLKEGEAGVMTVRGSDIAVTTNSGHITLWGDVKDKVCDLILSDLHKRLDMYMSVLESI